MQMQMQGVLVRRFCCSALLICMCPASQYCRYMGIGNHIFTSGPDFLASTAVSFKARIVSFESIMAEIIGLLGSIAGLIDIAAKVSVGLVKVAREIGAAGQEIRVIARHTNLISNVLSNLHTLMRKRVHATESSLRCEILLEDALQHCLEILNDCERLIRIFEPLIEKSGRRRTRATLRIRMVFEKSRFMAHGDALEKLTGILTLLVTSMNYFHSTESNTTRQTR